MIYIVRQAEEVHSERQSTKTVKDVVFAPSKIRYCRYSVKNSTHKTATCFIYQWADSTDRNIFGTLKTSHANDFDECLFPRKEGGPREPWHDILGLVKGPIAYDILINFM